MIGLRRQISVPRLLRRISEKWKSQRLRLQNRLQVLQRAETEALVRSGGWYSEARPVITTVARIASCQMSAPSAVIRIAAPDGGPERNSSRRVGSSHCQALSALSGPTRELSERPLTIQTERNGRMTATVRREVNLTPFSASTRWLSSKSVAFTSACVPSRRLHVSPAERFRHPLSLRLDTGHASRRGIMRPAWSGFCCPRRRGQTA